IDVLMLGSGRPFVVEISEPRVRSPDFDRIAKRIRKQSKRKVEVSELELTNRKRAQNLKDEASQNIKEYEAIISVQGKVSKEDLNHVAEEFSGLEIQQRTPARVAHRRSDLVRTKQIYEVRLEKKREGKINGFFKVQGGTYVKELISGDDGRTTPSIAEKLGVLCECQELTVIAIYD
ncbi:MAG: tRNA pseudouridine(54/55) synthase Pus10, partial [Candidatus Hodarchaeota archaeon]